MQDHDEKLAEARRKYRKAFVTDSPVPRVTPKSARLLEIEQRAAAQAQKDSPFLVVSLNNRRRKNEAA